MSAQGARPANICARFWHPIAYTQQLTDLPLALKIMGEELVLFRDKGGRIGLVEAHCPHRGTSFEYGKIEERGIRCCYHSWLIDIDGKILETPGEPEESTLKDRLYHGAYPVKEYGSIVFAYMGPPEKLPEFPLLDLYERPGFHLEPGEVGAVPNVKPCNWLQIVDNLVDPQHEEFLHATISGIQSFDDKGRLAEEKAIIGEGEFVESPAGIITLDMRRVKDSVWVRNIEFRWPNLAILGGTPIFPPEYGPGQTEIHNPPHLIFWVVPIDDSTSMEITFVVTPEGGANPRLKRMFSRPGIKHGRSLPRRDAARARRLRGPGQPADNRRPFPGASGNHRPGCYHDAQGPKTKNPNGAGRPGPS